ncbi:uncharacterized protein LOC129941473 [Eupeodes corollae]|uniref:uncharacterized protein LOC129941473 n=1 Tax=Eupeodes corollae TaxID=290404 RepID=UPI00248F7873|nr:uncharacterized protein LOC129941473 [Eupeodes corollae]
MPRRKCTFNEDLRTKFTSFKKGKYDWEVCCSICNCTISIANKGRRDIEDHVKSEKHSKNLRASTSSAALDSFVVRRPAADQKHLKAAEATIAYHTVFHHQSFNSLDCTIKLNQKIYFDSNICKQLSCARTKATAIITNVIAPFSISQVLCDLKTIAFISVQTDASNHLALKMFPVLIRYYDFKNGGTKSKILNLAFEKNEKSDTITQLIVETLTKNNLLTKCIGFCADNCNTNFGGRQRKGSNNVYSKLKLLVNQNMIGVGCPPHVLNNAIFHGCDTLPVDVDIIIVKIYNYFSIYTVRTERLRDFAEFLDNEYKPLLYHSKTRWLSLYPAVERLLLMFEVLKSYFEEVENPPKILIEFFKDDLSEAYLFLVHSLMSIFNFNIQDISIIETVNVLQNIVSNIQERINSNFIPIKIKSIMKKLVESGLQEKLARPCEFGDFLSAALRDRLICGLYNENIQKRLLSEENISFETACTKAISMEVALIGTKAMHHDDAVAAVKSSKKPQSQAKCGRQHNPSTCPAQHWKCFAWNQKGHTSKVCRKGCLKEKTSKPIRKVGDSESSDEYTDDALNYVNTVVSQIGKDVPILSEKTIVCQEILENLTVSKISPLLVTNYKLATLCK